MVVLAVPEHAGVEADAEERADPAQLALRIRDERLVGQFEPGLPYRLGGEGDGEPPDVQLVRGVDARMNTACGSPAPHRMPAPAAAYAGGAAYAAGTRPRAAAKTDGRAGRAVG
ncbi:hypothetical protein [Planomonospora venezuelensis]|uniref:Uncharacterized protein n=1 Tax=Planomonospora venezuelensis TaxID=1999 RepID=A0A841D6S8_PLAVE|nr:hypothetical protein [Planomonospora venezuelensis]MBB5964058.1 hypothetical protein [Planomonospora venezuelensis]GIM99681.1 hypothetical protein Pve01_13400 [Planomonospora venezuelensis]